jgi:hypothetical protein
MKPDKVVITKDSETDKKMKAVFYDKEGKKIKTTRFGADGYSDFTKHKDEQRKQKYINRHKKNENWNDPTTAGSLSRYILWGEPTIKKSIQKFKNKFKLK